MYEKRKSANVLKLLSNTIKNHIYLQAAIMNLLFAIMIIWLVGVSFESNDDLGMASLAYGATGEYSAHLVFINSFVGLILKILLKIMPTIPWYSVLMFVLIYTAFTIITYIFLKKDRIWGWLLAGVILLTFGYGFYSTMQFTRVSGSCTIAGILLLVDSFESRKYKKLVKQVIAAVCCIFGTCYRFNMFELIIVCMAVYCLYILLKRDRSIKKIIEYAITFAVVFGLCLSIRLVHINEFQNNKYWGDYKTFNTYRSHLLDHGFPDYDQNMETYEALGISKEDLALYKSWDFADPDIFNTNAVKTLYEIKEDTVIDMNFWNKFFQWFPTGLLKYGWQGGFLIIILYALYNEHWKKNLKFVLGYLAIISGFEVYCTYVNRYLLQRVDICVFLATAISIAVMSEVPSVQKLTKRQIFIALLALLLIRADTIYEDIQLYEAKEEKKVQAQEMCELVSADKEHLYLCSVPSSTMWNNAQGFWSILEKGAKSNYYGLGGWGAYSPVNLEVLSSYGISNPFIGGVDREDVYWIDNKHISSIESYIQRHYHESASAALVKEINGYSIYKIRTRRLILNIDSIADEKPNAMVSDCKVEWDGNRVVVFGTFYIDGESSYKGEAYIMIEEEEVVRYYQLLQYENSSIDGGDDHGQYSAYRLTVGIDENCEEISIIYRGDNQYYRVGNFHRE